MADGHFDDFKRHKAMREQHKAKAAEKRSKAGNIPVVKDLEEWLATRYDAKAEHHDNMARESAAKHAEEIKKKHGL